MGRRARERQRREFDLDVLVSRLERLYTELLAARASSGSRRRGARAVLARLRAAPTGQPADGTATGTATESPGGRYAIEPHRVEGSPGDW
jgi:hypothetical protein